MNPLIGNWDYVNCTIKNTSVKGTISFKEDGTFLAEVKMREDHPTPPKSVVKGTYSVTGNQVEYNNSAEDHNTTIQEGTYQMKVFTFDKRVRRIKFNKLKFYSNLTVPDVFLKLDNVVKNVTLPAGKQTDAQYAIDPTELEFEDATLTINATGNVLYKCKL